VLFRSEKETRKLCSH